VNSSIEVKMDQIVVFLANPIVVFIGYVLSLIAAIIAVSQFLGKRNAEDRVRELTVEVEKIKMTSNKNEITQGNKSQYFQENSGPVNIDNRD
jgi:fumarate reductase subunit C